MDEYVVLVNENNVVLGKAGKLDTHHKNTPLHRGFSIFVFNPKGEVLLQQRSKFKKTWPMVWSNSCCGHPVLNETSEEAARRRLEDELGLTEVSISVLLPEYHYRFEHKDIVENELCPVMIGFTRQQPVINHIEVSAVHWMPWEQFLEHIINQPQNYSEWCVEEAQLLQEKKEFRKLYKTYKKVV